jgi:hypothetical protein
MSSFSAAASINDVTGLIGRKLFQETLLKAVLE